MGIGGGLAVAAPPPGPGADGLLRTRSPSLRGGGARVGGVTGAPGSAGAGTRGRAGGRGAHSQRGGPVLLLSPASRQPLARPGASAPPMAEVLEPDPATAERAAAQAVETPGWTAPEDAGPQVGASRGRGRCGPERAG